MNTTKKGKNMIAIVARKKNTVRAALGAMMIAASLVNESRAMEPAVLSVTPVRRSTAQIMQGQVPGPLTPLPLTPPASGRRGMPTIANHFTVADYQETGQYGPSGESSVGSTQLLVASKGRIRSFLKDGRIDNVLNLSHDSFFSPISLGGFTADPNVIFHPIWNRWIIFADTILTPSLLLAVSDSDPITPATVWSFYVVDTLSNLTPISPFTPSTFFDYTTLGADAQAVYCAANILDYNNPTIFVSAAAYAIPKSSLQPTATTATVYAWRPLVNLGPNNLSPFTFQPALNFDEEPQAGYFPCPAAGYFPSIDLADATAGFGTKFLVNTVTFNDGGAPTLSDPFEVPVLPYALPLTVTALGTPATHTISPAASFRLAPAHVRDNRLWLVNNIGVDNIGVSSLPALPPPAGEITRDAARFTQIDVTKICTTPADAVVSQGTLFQKSATNVLGEKSYLTPSIMSNANGDVLIAATVCSATRYLDAVVAQLIKNNTAVGLPVIYTASMSDYYATEDWEFRYTTTGPIYARWGDHTRVSPDPEDPSAFWTAQQWCSDTNTWALEVALAYPH